MLLYLFPLLWGGLISIILCAPKSYYLLFISIFAVSVFLFFYIKRFNIHTKKHFYILWLIPFALSYFFCTYSIFKPVDFKYVYNIDVSSDKKAVIFYCNGDMEKYSPFYANYLLRDMPLILKPIYAFKIKNLYSRLDSNSTNKNAILVAKDVKNSLMNYKPYYFYIAFSNYFPDIKASIQSAITDGCKEIIIINYTNIQKLDMKIGSDIKLEELNKMGLKLTFTDSVYNSGIFADAIVSKVMNMPAKWDGIMLYDEATSTSRTISSKFVDMGYDSKSIIISTDIGSTMDYFKQNKMNNILYINLMDSGGNKQLEYSIIKQFEKYSDEMKIAGINSWENSKGIVSAVISTFKKVSN